MARVPPITAAADRDVGPPRAHRLAPTCTQRRDRGANPAPLQPAATLARWIAAASAGIVGAALVSVGVGGCDGERVRTSVPPASTATPAPPPAGAGSEQGPNRGSERGSEPGSEPGSERSSEPGSEPGSERTGDASVAGAALALRPTAEPMAAGAPTSPAPTVATSPPPEAAAWVASRVVLVRAEPDHDAAIVGRIDPGHAFAVWGLVAGSGDRPRACAGSGWAQLDAWGYGCLEHARAVADTAGSASVAGSDVTPTALPVVPEGAIAPFEHARVRATRAGATADAGGEAAQPELPGRWRSRYALYRGAPADERLELDHTYAFVARRRAKGVGAVLIDERDRAVIARDLQVLRPSEFEGAAPDAWGDADADAVALGFAVGRPSAALRELPGEQAPVVGELPYHARVHLDLRDLEAARAAGGVTFVRVRAAAPAPSDAAADVVPAGDGAVAEPAWRYAARDDVRVWIDAPPPAEVAADEPWVDVDVSEQLLALRRGSAVEWLTLVSTGKSGDSTPTGTYRVWRRQAHDDMRSLPDAPAEDRYLVEGVPWVLYFHQRYALHGATWHDRFGRRNSHGCVNLSPKDARRVYEALGPTVPPGWTFADARGDARGSVIRVRRSDGR